MGTAADSQCLRARTVGLSLGGMGWALRRGGLTVHRGAILGLVVELLRNDRVGARRNPVPCATAHLLHVCLDPVVIVEPGLAAAGTARLPKRRANVGNGLSLLSLGRTYPSGWFWAKRSKHGTCICTVQSSCKQAWP